MGGWRETGLIIKKVIFSALVDGFPLSACSTAEYFLKNKFRGLVPSSPTKVRGSLTEVPFADHVCLVAEVAQLLWQGGEVDRQAGRLQRLQGSLLPTCSGLEPFSLIHGN